ncbi:MULTISPECIES: dephospho-CoA kinase [unclassified Clostridioides]|uniref:dephospho-CoA kinase n=1 Tax=unclassified Clostridioides TaxID=2635829 RepID=UPI001D0FC128|nr:dephospho-CoA kinase [Clostridioides sp. ZZV14-6150]MCC0659858.1 dephospho-CoA kinase [Clostridioides sp. ZZV14-6154]MCC0666627.1 dephospho-CoA kinase [Clostridioides sp. ZZV14-6153]MCC0717649.1 dephospho-CoA kinase [Clostridioides sp. ZZV14-6105]MCC0722782.1 dephospho-CoA kinase [Clostridioides sp. ZZV14-6104]MCC0725344.1 dephospho-CoA kinase [Clostridioides sp. ZZV14-6045]MCC0729089.1 dephospho-CoA kinase [Clostridioides sp. ZZV14-6048]MCC0734161.1 dephospho-CoA kinase [Clostridioides s
MLILGLTGGIGCGKSSLSNIFRKFNITIVDADIISRQIFDDKLLLEAVFKHFGRNIKKDDGTLDRKALGKIVFNDEEKLNELNNLTHPIIREKIISDIEEARKKGEKIVILDAAILVESGFLEIVDKLLVVTCKQEVQISRIQKRDNCSKQEALSRINSQMSQEEKSKYGDYIIDNSGTITELENKVYKFIEYMKENWRE